MARIPQPANSHGSLKDLQDLINGRPQLIDQKIKSVWSDLGSDQIIWKSPLANDGFAEYRDDDFLKVLGLTPETINLKNFWPIGGPQWDALAITSGNKVVLVEAKANIPELVSPPTGAGIESKIKIDAALKEVKHFLNIENNIDWSGKFFQYTNRLAHLFFLRERCGIPAYLCNIYFTGDKSVKGPESEAEWKGAIQVMKTYLGVTHHKLQKYIGDVFISIN